MAHRRLATIRPPLFTILSVLSMLLGLATSALWVRSHWRLDAVHNRLVADESYRVRSLTSVRGELCYTTALTAPPPPRLPPLGWTYLVRPPRDPLGTTRSFLGFGFLFQDYSATNYWRGIYFPHWFLALLFAILPALHLRSAIRSRRRHRAGLCPTCGYDLRATPERCPECGTERVLATDEHR